METFAGALKFFLPIFLLLMIIELIAAKVKKKNVINSMDAVSSLCSGLTNTLFKILGLTIYLLSYDFLLKHIIIFKVESKALEYIISFLVIDLYVYWRHEYNILRNEHLIHHSSEEHNLPVALRQTVTDFVNPATFLLAPAAMLGF
jgi:alkylglycerol monooxygenase